MDEKKSVEYLPDLWDSIKRKKLQTTEVSGEDGKGDKKLI